MILYGISNCDTVRKARKFLEANSLSFQFHDFRKDGFSLDVFNQWLKFEPLEVLINKRSTSWKQLTDEQKKGLVDGTDLTPILQMPTLIKRPILQMDNCILVGFKEADYQAIV